MGIVLPERNASVEIDGAFADAQDYAICRQIHRQYGTTYYFASQLFAPEIRQRTHALYSFVRVPDEWVDNPNGATTEEIRVRLSNWRLELRRGLEGIRPNHPALRAFCDVLHETQMPLEEPMLFLDAMELDLVKTRYQTYEDLRSYMRGSASAVGYMMCSVLGAPMTPETTHAASALGEAMQMTNFLRDVGEDAQRGRIYLPLEDLTAFGVTEKEILDHKKSPQFTDLMRFQICRARALYSRADKGIPLLPKDAQFAVLMARTLYSRILDRIERQGYDVFSKRARISRFEKLRIAASLYLRK